MFAIYTFAKYCFILAMITKCVCGNASDTQLSEVNFASKLNEFSFNLLRKCNYEESNIIYSPLSVAIAIGMLLKGAKSVTADEINKLFGINDFVNKDIVHQYFSNILVEYKEISTSNKNARNETIELANLVMIAKNFTIQRTFKDAVRNNYKATVSVEDFHSNGLKIKEKVNKFVKQKTHELIPKVLEEPLSSDTLLYLMNTIYFKAFWKEMFSEFNNLNRTFYNSDKSDKTVEFMTEEHVDYCYYNDNDRKFMILKLEYLGNSSFIIILPHERYGLKSIIENYSYSVFEESLRKCVPTEVDLYLPKFNIELELNLKKMLKKLNVNSLDAPDLSGIANGIKVSDATHKAFISVNEAGTEAAAVTAIKAIPLSLTEGKPEFNVNHPFLFFIRDQKRDINLFAGVLNKI